MADNRKGWSSRFDSARFGVGRYHYELTPWVWDASIAAMPHWRMPSDSVGSVDLRPLPAQALAGGAPQGFAFVASTQPAGGVQIAHALNFTQETATTSMRDAWEGETGYRPDGANVVDLLWDQLTTGADPTGENGPKPLMPGRNGLELYLGGHSLVKRESFTWGVHPHTSRVQEVMQRDFERLWEESNGGDHCRRILDFLCKRHRVADWREFVPARLRPHVPGRLPHATTITDDFNRANAAAVGSSSEGWSWTEMGGGRWSIASNRLTKGNVAGEGLRADSDLSSDDHYAQAVKIGGADPDGPAVRYSSSEDTCYVATFAITGGGRTRLYKVVTGTPTALIDEDIDAVAANDTVKTDITGSTLTGHVNDVEVMTVTDTAITGNVRTGFYSTNDGSPTYDDFEASDGVAPGGLSIPIAAYHYLHHLGSMA